MFSVGQLFNRFFFSSTFWAMDKRQKNSSWIYHWLWYYLFVQYLTCDTYKSVDDLAMALRPSNILLNAFSSCLLLVYLSLLIFNIVFTEHETVLSANTLEKSGNISSELPPQYFSALNSHDISVYAQSI